MFMIRARILLATLWVGSLWTVGYIVAPTLFASLPDRVLAGTIAGHLFRVEAWLSMVCAMLLIALHLPRAKAEVVSYSKTVLVTICVMLALTLILHFGLQPLMSEMRAEMHTALREHVGVNMTGGVMASEAKMQFGILHGVSSALYLIESALGVFLILKLHGYERRV